MEKALEVQAQKIGDHGFPPRLDVFKAMIPEPVEQSAEQTGDPTLAEPGEIWLQRFPNRHSQGFLNVWVQSGPSQCIGR